MFHPGVLLLGAVLITVCRQQVAWQDMVRHSVLNISKGDVTSDKTVWRAQYLAALP